MCRFVRADRNASEFLNAWPTERPKSWIEFVNGSESESELDDLRSSAQRGQPFGSEDWVMKIAKQLGLDSPMTAPGRSKRTRKYSRSLFRLPGVRRLPSRRRRAWHEVIPSSQQRPSPLFILPLGEREEDVNIPMVQQRAPAPELNTIRRQYQKRDEAIRAAYDTGVYSYQQIAKFGVHFTTVGGLSADPRGGQRAVYDEAGSQTPAFSARLDVTLYSFTPISPSEPL